MIVRFRVRKRLQAGLVQEISPLPEVVVFDLDCCLWPYWCEMNSASAKAKLYPESLAVLHALRCAMTSEAASCGVVMCTNVAFDCVNRVLMTAAPARSRDGRYASVKMVLASRKPTPHVARA